MEKSKNRGGGRPSAYKPEFVEQAYHYCLLGATDAQLAEFFQLKEQTINNWKKKYPEFAEALQCGKMIADAQVARSLFKRATGYSHPETHLHCLDGQIVQTAVIKYYAPDTTACIFWLKNRQPAQWRDKTEVNAALKLDQETLAMIESQFVRKMAAAHERQKAVLAERGIDWDASD